MNFLQTLIRSCYPAGEAVAPTFTSHRYDLIGDERPRSGIAELDRLSLRQANNNDPGSAPFLI